jgi:hypothetical protein
MRVTIGIFSRKSTALIVAIINYVETRKVKTIRKLVDNPVHQEETLLLVMHGASCKSTLQYLTGKEIQSSVGSFAIVTLADPHQPDSGGGSGGGSAGAGAAAGKWTLTTNPAHMETGHLNAVGAGVEGAGDNGSSA